jgi:hypothetical protein
MPGSQRSGLLVSSLFAAVCEAIGSPGWLPGSNTVTKILADLRPEQDSNLRPTA